MSHKGELSYPLSQGWRIETKPVLFGSLNFINHSWYLFRSLIILVTFDFCFLLNLFLYNEEYLSNFNGKLKIEFNNLNNKLIKNGFLEFSFNQKKINLIKANFDLYQIGKINSDLNFVEDKGEIKFMSTNQLKIENHIEFAKAFQIGSNKVKNIKQINFDLEKNVEETNFVIKNVKINNKEAKIKLDEPYLINNIQNLRSYIRKAIN